jgi:two-component system phosphate regulon sensor histidine kinase PhoR
MVKNIIISAIFLALFFITFKLRIIIKSLRATLKQTKSELLNKAETGHTGEAKLDAILSSMVEGVLVTDRHGKITLLNPSLRKTFLIDAPPEGKKPIEIIRNISIQEIVDKTLAENQQKPINKEISLNYPEEKFFKVTSAQIIKNHEIQGCILVFHNITELRRLEKIRQDFVANVSHELRTPLSSIKGYSETLLNGALDDKENMKKFTEIIYNETNRLAKIIDDLLDLSKIESGKINITFLPTDISNIIKRTISIIENQAKVKLISIHLSIPEQIPQILADETRISQVFLNLLDNAIKYTPNNGIVTISVEQKNKFVQISIKDTGIGIPEKDISRLFERFYRVDKARSRELGGTGLGLSIAKHIIQSHGGEISVQSEEGNGATFSLTVPIA